MFGAIVKGLFNLVIKLFELLLTPIIAGITILFPSLGTFFTAINTFLNYSLTYVGLCLDLLFVPNTAIVALFDYFIITYSIYLLSIGVRFGITIYQKFKF